MYLRVSSAQLGHQLPVALWEQQELLSRERLLNMACHSLKVDISPSPRTPYPKTSSRLRLSIYMVLHGGGGWGPAQFMNA